MSEGRAWQRFHAHLLMRQDRASRELQAQMSAEVAAAVQDVCGDRDVMDPGCYHAAMRAVDRIMDRYYGVRRGDQSALWYQLALDQATYAKNATWAMARRLVTRHLSRFDPDLLKRLKEMGRNDGNP